MVRVTTGEGARIWILPSLDIVAALVALWGLLPLAGGLPSIASTGEPLADGIWFTVSLGGAFLLLAGGINQLLPTVQSPWFVVIYVASIGLLGIMRLQFTGFNRLAPGWLVLVFCVGGLLLVQRRPWIWATTGAAWCTVLLALSVTVATIAHATDGVRFPFFLPLLMVGCGLAIASLVLHVRYRGAAARG
jgi:hypothetical protein